jgi:predicted DNA-binding transcriptional regulator AlpA
VDKTISPRKKHAAAKPLSQKVWLKQTSLLSPLPETNAPPVATPRGSRLLDRHDIMELTGASYPTIWAWMRAGTFPRGRIVGGKTKWVGSEVESWLRALPVRRLKGDDKVVT